MPDISWDTIEAEWGHRLPDLYQQIYADGLLDPQHPEYLQFTDLVWQNDLQIAAWEPDPRQVPGLLPLAESLTGDELCWYPHIDPDHPHAVVWCPDDDEVARIYAPDFATCLYRLMLDECAGTWLVEEHDRDTAQQLLQRMAAALVPYLPAAWNDRLGIYVQRPLGPIDEHTWACIDEDEVLAALEVDTGYRRYDREFAHLVDE
jgi:hypothetical protein